MQLDQNIDEAQLPKLDSFSLSSYSEIYLKNLQSPSNTIYKSDYKPRPSQTKEWAQFFDLNGTVLICQVYGNELELRLMHISDQSTDEYYLMLENGRFQLASLNINQNTYSKSVEEAKIHIRQAFKNFSSAKIYADGAIVQSIVLQPIQQDRANVNSNLGYQSLVALQSSYKLSFVTSSNLLYQVEFDKYYLKDKDTIHVKEPFDLNRFVVGSAKAADIYFNPINNVETILVGTALSYGQQKNTTEIDANSESALFIIQQGLQDGGVSYKQLEKATVVTSFFKGIKQTIKDKLQPVFLPQKKLNEGQDQRVSQRTLGEEGVVAVKSLENGFFCVIYSTGLLRIWSVLSQNQLVYERDLLESLPNEDNDQAPEIANKNTQKITNAKITSIQKSKMNYYEDDPSMEIKIAIAFSTQSALTLQQKWNIDQYQFSYSYAPYESGPLLVQQILEKYEFSQISSEQQEDQIVITDILLETDSEQQTHLWLATFNEKSKKSQLKDQTSSLDNIWDRQSQNTYASLLDEVDIPQVIHDYSDGLFIDILRDHYQRRIQQKNRFTKGALTYQLRLLNYLTQDTQIYESVENLCIKETTQGLQKFIKQVQKIENENSRILGISQQCKNYPFNFLIRPLGISIFNKDSLISTINNLSNKFCNELAETKDNQTSETIQELLNGGNDENLLVNLLGSIRFMSLKVQDQLDQQINNNPDQINRILQQTLREIFQYEALHQELISTIEQNRYQVDIAIQEIQKALIDDFLLKFCQQTEDNYYPNLRHGQSNYSFSLDIVQFIASGLINEITSLYEVLRDLSLLRIYIDVNLPYALNDNAEYQQRSQMHRWLTQILTLKITLSQNFDIEFIQRQPNNITVLAQQFQQLQQLDTFNQGSVINYLLLEKPQIVSPTLYVAAQINNEKTQLIQMSVIFKKLIQLVTFNGPIQSQTYIPYLTKKLINNKQWDSAFTYLRGIGQESTIALAYCRAYVSAMIGCDPSLVKFHFDSAISHLLTLSQPKMDLNLKEISNEYQVYLIRQAINTIQHLSLKESDYLYTQLFNASSMSQLDLLYQSCTSIQNKDKRKKLLGQFFEMIYQEKENFQLAQTCFFSQDDISLGLESFFEKVENRIYRANDRNKPEFALDDFKNILFILNSLSQLYLRENELCRYLWQIQLKLQKVTSEQNSNILPSQQQSQKQQLVKDLLQAQKYALVILYQNCLKLGNEFFITDNTNVSTLNLKKRKSHSILDNQKIESSEEFVKQKGYQFLDECITESKYLKGQVKQIEGEKDIIQAIRIVDAQLSAIDIQYSQDIEMLIKILTETNNIDDAINLGLISNKQVYYALSVFITKILDRTLIEDLICYKPQGQQDELIWNYQQIMRNESINGKTYQNKHKRFDDLIRMTLDKYLDQIKPEDQIQLALTLALQKQKVPNSLIKSLIGHKLTTQLIEILLRNDVNQYEEALNIIHDYSPISLKVMAEQNIQFLVFSLKTFEKVLKLNEEDYKKQNKRLSDRENIQRDDNDFANEDFIKEIKVYLDSQQQNGEKDIQEAINIVEDEEAMDSEQRNDSRVRKVKDLENIVSLYKDKLPKIKQDLVKILNQ